jgi:hypothetical protein
MEKTYNKPERLSSQKKWTVCLKAQVARNITPGGFGTAQRDLDPPYPPGVCMCG